MFVAWVTTNLSQRIVGRLVQLPAPVTFILSQLAYNGFGIFPSSAAVSSPNIAFATASAVRYTVLLGTFVIPSTTTFTPGRTDFLSFNVVATKPGQSIPWMAAIYGAGNPSLLGMVSGTTDKRVTFSLPAAEITGFSFWGPSFEGIDNM